MRTISVEEAAPGDVLAEPLTNAKGQVLLPKGARLTAAVLARCRGWGVETVCVEGEDADAADVQRRLEDLELRFAGLEDDELMQQIKQIARVHLQNS